jgi:hypothetical protein
MEISPLQFVETSPGVFYASKDGRSYWIKKKENPSFMHDRYDLSIFRITPDPSDKPIFTEEIGTLGCAKQRMYQMALASEEATSAGVSVAVNVVQEITKEQAFDYIMSHLSSSAIRDGSGRVGFMINGYFNIHKDPVAQFIYEYNNTRKNELERQRELAELARLKAKYEGTK